MIWVHEELKIMSHLNSLHERAIILKIKSSLCLNFLIDFDESSTFLDGNITRLNKNFPLAVIALSALSYVQKFKTITLKFAFELIFHALNFDHKVSFALICYCTSFLWFKCWIQGLFYWVSLWYGILWRFGSMVPKFFQKHSEFSSRYLSALYTGREAINAYCPMENLLSVYISWLIWVENGRHSSARLSGLWHHGKYNPGLIP